MSLNPMPKLVIAACVAMVLPAFAGAAETPVADAVAGQTVATTASTEPTEPGTPQRRWELDTALFKTLYGDSFMELGSVRLAARGWINDVFSIGLDVRYWPAGAYPLSEDAGRGSWAGGAAGQFYLFHSKHWGAYLGASLLWVPTDSQAVVAPEAGIKWFATSRVGIGLSYWLLTDVQSSSVSISPAVAGKSRQNLGLELSVYL